ncbi:hypothetical protein JOD62_001116 [Microbacterium keratanolyticum]|uniref:Uncharacterized protein n=1 Tax=Microbacterium keratanolyticum TaxID=67574 RepID=A0A9W6HRB7_9MICO|nr:hypothetical protein [Microbacterium keratanolyticum]MBM7468568.1 hypothetical protein [Microbacterium keratanolyticum]GLK00645.1 hypothetical protein GCM10017596_03600 [Microbacterium keratanolyticum]
MQHSNEAHTSAPQDTESRSDPAAIKERIYATFTGLAIVLVQSANVDHTSAVRASITLLIGILAIAAAGFVADLLAHLAVSGTFPHGPELRRLLALTGTAIGSAMVPLLALLLAVLGWIELQTALAIAAVAYVGVLGLVGYVAVRRTRVSWWRQLIALGILIALGCIVIVIQQLAHGH